MRIEKTFVWIVLLSVLVGCSGTMQGAIRGSKQPVQFTYEQGINSDKLTAVVDGETFQGKAVMRGASSTFGTSFGTAQSGSSAAFGTGTFSGSTTTGDYVATLLGTRGSSLSCELQYADTSGFTTLGGVGVCQHSDGRIIDVVW